MVAHATDTSRPEAPAAGGPPAWSPLAGSLPRHAPDDARLLKLTHDRRLAALLRTLPALENTRLELSSPAPGARPRVWVLLGHANDAGWLGLDDATMPALSSLATPRRQGDADAHAALGRAIASQLLSPLLAFLRTLGLPALDVLAVSGTAPALQACTLWRLALRQGEGRPLEAWFPTPPAGWLDAVAERIVACRGPTGLETSRLCLPAWLVLGRQAQRIRTLSALRSGDILLHVIDPEPARDIAAHAPFNATLRWVGAATPRTRRFLQAAVRVDGAQLTLQEAPRMTQELNEDLPDPDASDSAVPLDEVELPLQIEVAAMALAAADVAALQPGQVLTLPATVRDARVRLTVFGQQVATGELVCVGDHLGVRIRATERP
ncbi:Type III secretion inner membrane protein (YscQ,homologous to flagellar export components) [plant metagenome]|uniref:Type III secretion inner membrane protein (YscQ,homologous to flagellar export components) n=1 Tax=plant metagenome TaxID=1297885 RepID=A0A484TG49_9ZZZZ